MNPCDVMITWLKHDSVRVTPAHTNLQDMCVTLVSDPVCDQVEPRQNIYVYTVCLVDEPWRNSFVDLLIDRCSHINYFLGKQSGGGVKGSPFCTTQAVQLIKQKTDTILR